jgi:hypothetical protein
MLAERRVANPPQDAILDAILPHRLVLRLDHDLYVVRLLPAGADV